MPTLQANPDMSQMVPAAINVAQNLIPQNGNGNGKKFEWSKAGAGGIALEVMQHIGPPTVAWVQANTGVSELLSNELVYFAFSFVGAAGVWLTPSNFVSAVTDLILGIRRAFKKWRDAANQPLSE